MLTKPVKTRPKNRFAENIRWQYVANGSQALLGGAQLIFVARFLGTVDFGVLSSVMALISVASAFLEMRLQEVVARDFCQIDSCPEKCPPSLLLVDLIALEALGRIIPACIVLILSSKLQQLFNIATSSPALIPFAAMSFVLSKSGSSVSQGLLRVLGRTDLIAACLTFDMGLRLIFSVILALAWQLNVAIVLGIGLVAGLICNVLQIWLALAEFEKRIESIKLGKWEIVGAFKRLRFVQRLIVSNLGVSYSDLMSKELDVLLVSSSFSADKVGVYKMAKSFVQVLWRAIDPFYITIMPEVQKLWQLGRLDALKEMLYKFSARLFLFAFLLVLVGCLSTTYFGVKFIGAEYWEVPRLMIIMCPWLVVCAPIIWGSPLLIALNRPELAVWGGLIGTVVGLVTFTIFVSKLGLVGAALAWNMTIISSFLFNAAVPVWLIRARSRS